MNVLARRAVRRVGVGAAALIAAGAVVGIASPAYAAAPDLAVESPATAIAAGADFKPFIIKVKNLGTASATGITVTFDVSGLDSDKVQAEFGDECTTDAGKAICSLAGLTLNPDETFEYALVLVKQPGAVAGDEAGSFTVTVTGTGDDQTKLDNNTATTNVTIGGSGADFVAVALDVYAVDDEFNPTGPVPPGGTAPLLWAFFNVGDMAADGVQYTMQLPEHVTFVEDDAHCTYSEDGRKATCKDDDADKIIPSNAVFVPDTLTMLKVSADAPGPVNLTGGMVSGEAIASVRNPEVSTKSAPTLRGGLTMEEILKEVDQGDNTDDFTVFVGPRPAAPPAGGPGTLPITGVQVGVIGVAGVAVVAFGGMLLLLSRRRRVVAVAPEDGSAED